MITSDLFRNRQGDFREQKGSESIFGPNGRWFAIQNYDRIGILKVHLKKAVLAGDVDVEQIAALTTGFTGANLAILINEAVLLATRRGADRNCRMVGV